MTNNAGRGECVASSVWWTPSLSPVTSFQAHGVWRLLVASMVLGMDIQRQVLSRWPFSLVDFPSACLVNGISEQQMMRLSTMYMESYIHFRYTYVDQQQSHAYNMRVAYSGHCDRLGSSPVVTALPDLGVPMLITCLMPTWIQHQP